MWRRSIPFGFGVLLFVFIPSNHKSRFDFFGIKSVVALNKHQQQRQRENNQSRGGRQQQNNSQNQQNQWGDYGFGGDPFAGGGGSGHNELYMHLNVQPDATDKEIKSSYRKLALEVRVMFCHSTYRMLLNAHIIHPSTVDAVLFSSIQIR